MKNQLTFHFKNFGYIERGSINLSNLTIICGKNNVGKTYINYGIYGFMKSMLSNLSFISNNGEIKKLKTDGFLRLDLKQYESKVQESLKEGCKGYSEILHKFFATDEDFFRDSKLELDIKNIKFDYQHKKETRSLLEKNEIVKIVKPENSSIIEITLNRKSRRYPEFIVRGAIDNFLARCLLDGVIPNTQVISSERTGVSLFYKELDFTKNRMLDYLTKYGKDKKKFSPFDFLEKFSAQYPQTIQNNIETIRNLSDIKKKKSQLLKEEESRTYLSNKLKEIVQGEFKIVDDELFYSQRVGRKKVTMPIHMASSSVKALVLFDTYVRHIASKGDLLIIDEPELNLHPDLQVSMAQLIIRLINSGIHILITTHSDYILKEINNCIMLSHKFNGKKEFMNKHKYSDFDILDKNKISVYVNGNHTMDKVEIDKYGIKYEKLDSFICKLNNKSSLLVDSIESEG
ncbi:MAG: AAA family ATPase [Nanoarchaeota archaeon]|nr:AAA family ATPase [Nanoarchaeota archaeon]